MKKQNIVIATLIVLGVVSSLLFINRKQSTPFTVDENSVYKISDSGCFYSIYSEKDGGLFYVSGETKIDVSKYLDRPIKIKGKFLYTSQTPKGTNGLLYKQDKIASGECTVNNNFNAVAVVIDSIQ
jgi:hypothetical protein